MKFKHIIFIILLFYNFTLFGQHVLLEEDVRNYRLESDFFGPNELNFAHLYLGVGFMAIQSESQETKINFGSSKSYLVGYRYKRKLGNFLALGTDIQYNYRSYYLDQENPLKMLPDNIVHDQERISVHAILGDAFLRINIDRRGNMIGKFIDLGAYFSYNYSAKHIYTDKINDLNALAQERKVENLKIKYINATEYGLNTRIGNNNFAIYAHYRLSNLLNDQIPELSNADLSHLIIGLQFGLHK